MADRHGNELHAGDNVRWYFRDEEWREGIVEEVQAEGYIVLVDLSGLRPEGPASTAALDQLNAALRDRDYAPGWLPTGPIPGYKLERR